TLTGSPPTAHTSYPRRYPETSRKNHAGESTLHHLLERFEKIFFPQSWLFCCLLKSTAVLTPFFQTDHTRPRRRLKQVQAPDGRAHEPQKLEKVLSSGATYTVPPSADS
ncbi:unnamed protein product, partial [Ectocarpus sp. 6 AP-2014]